MKTKVSQYTNLTFIDNEIYKAIPGSDYYRISLRGDIIDHNWNKVFTEFKEFGIEIEMFGVVRKYSRTIYMLYAWYEVGDIVPSRTTLENIYFVPIHNNNSVLRLKTGHIMCFREPVLYGAKLEARVVPMYSRYAITKDSVVYDIRNNIILEKHLEPVPYSRNSTFYRGVNVYNPDSCINRRIRVHRLLALAWLANTDFQLRPYINHIDGNKGNNKLENLEWCSQQENNDHAKDNGLLSCQQPYKIRDRITGEIRRFISMEELNKALMVNKSNSKHYIKTLPGYLIKGRWEIKRDEDDSPWFYELPENQYIEPGKTIYIITVIDKEKNKKYRFNRLKKMYKILKIPKIYKEESAVEDYYYAINILNQKYDRYSFSIERFALIGPYKVVNIKTNQIWIVNSIPEIANIISIGKNAVREHLLLGYKYIYRDKFIIGILNADFNVKNFVYYKPVKGYQIDNVKTGYSKLFSSLREAERQLDVTRKTLAVALKDNTTTTHGYTVRTVYE